MTHALRKSGVAGKTKALLKGSGAALPSLSPPFDYPVTVQLRRVANSLCVESIFTAEHGVKNDTKQFKAKR